MTKLSCHHISIMLLLILLLIESCWPTTSYILPGRHSFCMTLETYETIQYDYLIKNIPNNPVKIPPFSTPLKNTYYGLRHGESTANLAGIISSDFEYGIRHHSLTENGRRQAKASVSQFESLLSQKRVHFHDIVIISSPFLRAMETAAVFTSSLLSSSIYFQYDQDTISFEVDNELRERFFGEYDKQDLLYYNRVWPIDQVDFSGIY